MALRRHVVNVRLTRLELAELKRLARRNRMHPSSLVRELLARELARVALAIDAPQAVTA